MEFKLKILFLILLLGFGKLPENYHFYLQSLKERILPKIYLSEEKLKQGDTLLVKLETNLGLNGLKGEFNGKKINFFKLENSWFSLLGIGVNEKPGKYQLVINLPWGEKIERKIEIGKRDFPEAKILLNQELKEKGYTPSKIVEGMATKEAPIVKKVLSLYTPKPYFKKGFIYPLDKIKDVGAFGSMRKSGEFAYRHLGVDLEADLGTPIYAINDGRVRLVQEFENYGKTLIIDHGLGIFSLYLHLKEFKVVQGQKVKRGEIIALSGNSGYSLSPHLHFSVKIEGKSVDPLKFIALTQKEFPK
jgi:murein DD-endopeptidase MepM/ murein hydrolase activator NlpD